LLDAPYHFHACVIEGLYAAAAEGVRFHEVEQLSEAAILQVQERVRRRVLEAFVRWGLLEADARDEMIAWQHGGGFSLDASVRIAADDRDGLERLLRYCARPPLAAPAVGGRAPRATALPPAQAPGGRYRGADAARHGSCSSV
jgi:hypothetical protein